MMLNSLLPKAEFQFADIRISVAGGSAGEASGGTSLAMESSAFPDWGSGARGRASLAMEWPGL